MVQNTNEKVQTTNKNECFHYFIFKFLKLPIIHVENRILINHFWHVYIPCGLRQYCRYYCKYPGKDGYSRFDLFRTRHEMCLHPSVYVNCTMEFKFWTPVLTTIHVYVELLTITWYKLIFRCLLKVVYFMQKWFDCLKLSYKY